MSQMNYKPGSFTLPFLVSVSFFGLILAVLLALHPPISHEDFVWRKPVIGSMFALVCVLGTLAVFFPNKCSRSFHLKKAEKHKNKVSQATPSVLRGHHPMCGRFSTHVFLLGGKMFCATCSGLFIGAMIVLVGIALFFFGNWQMGENAVLMVLAGAVGVTLGLLQSPLPMLQNSVIRLFSSAFFVVGTFLILVGVEELARNTSVDLFFVALSVFWLMTRISLSQWDHERICSICTLDSCSFVEWHAKREG